MHNILRSTAVMAMFASALFSGASSAGDLYVGLSRATPGEYYADFDNAKHVQSYTHPHAMKLYGGMALSERYSVELGYGFFGTWKIADPTPASSATFNTSSKLLYVAGKATMPVSESFDLFGKFGLAANKFSTERNAQPSTSKSFVRPMLGFGMDYRITMHISGVLEYNYYGASDNSTQQKVELGLKYSF
jgi:OOP family OmpA-OmpF porin